MMWRYFMTQLSSIDLKMSDDSAACPHLGLKDNSQQAVKSAEEERILRSMSKNAPKLSKNVLREAITGGHPGSAADSKLEVIVEGLPAAPGKPVAILVDGKQYYHSGSYNGPVQTSFKAPLADTGKAEAEVQLKIATKGFDSKLLIDLRDGCHLKLVYSDQGLQKIQQRQPF